MARKFKVNAKYVHFAIRKETGKIVNGWEKSEDIKHWSKIDLKDMFPENKFSDFKVITIMRTAKVETKSFYRNWDNWEKTSA